MAKGISGHQSAVMKSDEWLTPPEVLASLGEFDLDPCSPVYRPWDTAKNHYSIIDNGLLMEWYGRVWMNPPYGKFLINWLQKLSNHSDGIALTFARTDTAAFHKFVFPFAHSMLFIDGRLNFYTVAGTRARFNSGAPSVLIAYGEGNFNALENCNVKGKHIRLNYNPIIVVGISSTWISIIKIVINKLGDDELKPIYDMVEIIAPDKIINNIHWKAKVRQQLQVIRKKIFEKKSTAVSTLFDVVG